MSTDIRLITDPPLPGPWNMAVDEALLNDAIANGTATLRFYQWSEPTLSLGYFQCYAEREQHAASSSCAVVRRQSGGGAILHDRELTYSLALPPTHRLVHNAPQLYDAVHVSFIDVLDGYLGISDAQRPHLRLRGPDPTCSDAEPFLCFQRRSPGDIVLDLNSEESRTVSPSYSANSSMPWKILGSAQRRHRGAILQHGSLLIERSRAAPELPGLTDLSGISLNSAQLTSTLYESLAASLQLRLNAYQLSAELQSKAADLANTKYASPIWTKRR